MKESRAKEHWTCPACTKPLVNRKDTGEGVKWCEPCGTGWFIVRTRRLRKEQK